MYKVIKTKYITVNCEICKKKITIPHYYFKRSKHHYCSQICYHKGKSVFNISKKIRFKCEYCGKIFFTYKNRRFCKYIYCSLKCAYLDRKKKIGQLAPNWQGKTKEYICYTCGKKFKRASSTVKNNKSRHLFCSLACAYKKNHPYKKFQYKNIYFRSSWESLFAQWLDLSGIKWEYEPKTFNLGKTTYLPDFYLLEFNCWIEIKGWWRDDAKEKFKQFNKKYNNLNIKLFDKEKLKQLGVI